MTIHPRRALWLTPLDNVATVLEESTGPTPVQVFSREGEQIMEIEETRVPRGHKVAVKSIDPGVEIIKYGEVIGRAEKPIPQGAHVHVHNMASCRGRGDHHGL